nr:MAG TPA: PhnA Zinc-Ribbon [Caudoviricetes sp.]
MSEDIKKCKVCGRIITGKNNITGLCPKHQKGLNDGAAVVGIGVMALGLKKFGPKILKGTVKLIKR